MRHKLRLFNLVLIVVFIFSFTACTIPKTAKETTIAEITITETTVVETTIPETTAAETTAPEAAAKGKIAFYSNRDGNSEIYIMNVDGSGQINLTNNSVADDFAPSFSTDGSKIAFDSDRDVEVNWEICMMNVDGSEQVNLTNNPAVDGLPSFSPIPETTAEKTTVEAIEKGEYNIGDTGPAGGLIFYVNPNYKTDGWHYLEAAPSDQSTGILWDYGRDVATSATATVVGTGQANTQTIVKVLGAGSYAAQLCNDLAQGGYSDWFLPSKDELDLMYENLYLKGLGGFTYGSYWSSSENHAHTAWFQYYKKGLQINLIKTFYFRVRAARAF